ncbi:hypothetical protein DPMN_072376 [Dreissena polymorpha]|uniref:Uncharacterized protein n=1 Tax=Dreissena polymorpha TaxID=45954 RepID=A0A9D4BWS0_DREPO|nr:hypothetical protein DPMN_072376 [Dreissena polymorpha]
MKKRRPDNATLLVGKKRDLKERTDSAEKVVDSTTVGTYSVVNKLKKPGQLSENVFNKDNMPVDYIYSFVNEKNITDDPNNSIMHTATGIITGKLMQLVFTHT